MEVNDFAEKTISKKVYKKKEKCRKTIDISKKKTFIGCINFKNKSFNFFYFSKAD